VLSILNSLFHSKSASKFFWINPFMDPITAFVQLVTALTNLVATVVESQTPDQKKQIWDWYIQDRENIRKILKIDPDTK